jgi:hypothetical protein
MAKDNRLKKGSAAVFDENMLIGKLSGLSRSHGLVPEPAQPTETVQQEKERADAQESVPADAPQAAASPQERVGDREGEKTDKDPAPAVATPVAGNSTAAGAVPALPVKKPKSGKSWEYGRFLVATDGKKKAHVYITDENHAKIKQVLSLFGNKLAIADYLDNVLSQHWEQFDPEIQERMQQIFSKK